MPNIGDMTPEEFDSYLADIDRWREKHPIKPEPFTVVGTEWTLFTAEQAQNFGYYVIAQKCTAEQYGHDSYNGLIRARSTINDGEFG
jgi:hypothetical protein